MTGPTVLHLTTVDMSLALLLLPQLVGIRDAGYDVIGVSAPGPYVETLESHGIPHVPLRRSTRAADLRADLACAWEFAGLCHRLRPDIVHTHNPKPGVYGRIGARLAGVRAVVNTVHGLYAQPTDPLMKRAAVYSLERLASSFSSAELVQNVEDLPVLRRLRIPVRKLHLLGNGVDLTRFDPPLDDVVRRRIRGRLGLSDEAVVIGLVGRLVREKGYGEVFAAARQLRAHLPQLHFVVVGPRDPAKPDAVSQTDIDRVAREANVTFLGLRDDIEQLYAAMDIYVLASHREGFPRAAMEAAAMGLPIVATDIRGCRQVVEQGRTGLLVPVHDHTALAEAISRIATDPDLRTAMGTAARRKAVAEFDYRRQIALTLQVYKDLLRGSRGSERLVR